MSESSYSDHIEQRDDSILASLEDPLVRQPDVAASSAITDKGILGDYVDAPLTPQELADAKSRAELDNPLLEAPKTPYKIYTSNGTSLSEYPDK